MNTTNSLWFAVGRIRAVLASRLLAALALAVTLVLSPEARAQDIDHLITFEDLPIGTVVTTQYVAEGAAALFHQNFIVTDDTTPGNHLLANREAGTEFGGGTLTLNFVAPQHLVAFDGSFPGAPTETAPATLTAFDAAGNVVATQGPVTLAGDQFTAMSVSTATDVIDHIVFSINSVTANATIDNLELNGEPPPAATGQPVVVINTPVSGFTDASTVTVSGTVTGANIFQPASITVTFDAAPPLTSSFTNNITLTATADPNVFTFSFNQQIPAGLVTLTVSAQNVFGITGSAEVFLTNLPSGVLAECTPTGPLGDFKFAIELGTCTLNVCANGGITSHVASGASHVVPAALLQKWLTVSNARLPGNLGCPVSDAFSPSTAGIATVRQDYERGRLYSTGNDVFFVPGVFASAMAASGEELGVGVPVADPSVNTFALDLDTEWYQHFQRNAGPGDLGSTLEIRRIPFPGSPSSSTLTLERQGGDLTDLNAAATFGPRTATLWDRFKCTGFGPWNCTITPPQPHVPPPAGFASAIHAFCANGNPEVCSPDQTPFIGKACSDSFPVSQGMEWVSLPGVNGSLANGRRYLDNFDYKDLKGWVKTGGAHLSSSDFPTTHSFTNDYVVHVRPLPAYDGILGANFSDLDVEIEIEWYYFMSFWKMDLPTEGDLFFVNGRWIGDCGHNPNPTEIHPPAIIATLRTAPSAFDPSGPPTTSVHVTANGFLLNSGSLRIDPPPRPTPDSELFVFMPSDSGSVVGGIAVTTNIFVDHIELNFARTPAVTDVNTLVNISDQGSGEMYWHSGLSSYSGIWNVGWN